MPPSFPEPFSSVSWLVGITLVWLVGITLLSWLVDIILVSWLVDFDISLASRLVDI